ncbi:putative uncharacterized protein MSANTD5 [Mesocricetus auratus]|uniref:Uncharacterized protein n=1 Tax=Mesocricetus auratus TaxID=10036 RepID=A0ABM2X0J7_MESAU|nr:putative uncharacterized protein MSANTD5 [Mesocricetus auratus]
MDRSGNQEDQRSSAPSSSRWTDGEIRIFLMEWEVVEQEVGHPGRKIHKKTRALCQRLYQRGLKKTWKSCFDLLVNLQNVHRILCSERPGNVPLFSPYTQALYRILGPRPQAIHFPGPIYDGAGYPLVPMEPQPPMVLPHPLYHPWDNGFQVSPGEHQWTPSAMYSNGYSGFPQWDTWDASSYYPSPQLFPPSVPGDTSIQDPSSSSYDHIQGPQ